MKKNPLLEHCDSMVRKAGEAAARGDREGARACLFDGLESLKYLCDAERNLQVREMYENRARKMLSVAKLIREEGISPRVRQLLGVTSSGAGVSGGRAPSVSAAPSGTGYAPGGGGAPSQPSAGISPAKSVPPASGTSPSGGGKFFDPFAEPPAKKAAPSSDAANGGAGMPGGRAPAEDMPEDDGRQGAVSRVTVSGTGSAPASHGAEEKPAQPFDTIGNAMRPQTLKDYYGQPQTVAILTDATAKARLSDSALSHVLLYGSHGLGKTTLAKILANEMQTGFYEINNAGSLTAEGMIDLLKKVKKGDIVFIDEIHNIPSSVAEGVLYSAMEDFTVKYVTKKGKSLETAEIYLPPFTLVGATTESGKLLKPFKDRFGIECHLNPYSESILAMIAKNSFKKLGMTIGDDLAADIARRARSTPRIVNRFVSRIADKAIVHAAAERGLTEKGALSTPEKIKALHIEVTPDILADYFEQNGIDEKGLTDGDRILLRLIVEKYNGGPVGLDSLAKAMNESQNVVADQYEAYLTKIGMLMTTSRGRMAMPAAYRYLGLPVPAHIRDFFAADIEEEPAQPVPEEPSEPAPQPETDGETDIADGVPAFADGNETEGGADVSSDGDVPTQETPEEGATDEGSADGTPAADENPDGGADASESGPADAGDAADGALSDDPAEELPGSAADIFGGFEEEEPRGGAADAADREEHGQPAADEDTEE